jgi:tRNA(adenine34) deaminase
MPEPDDEYWMRRAIARAREGEAREGTNPIGCVIVRDGVLLAESCNEVDLHCDPTAHAEIVAIRRAGAKLQCHEMRGATLYTTLQPCGMCTMACLWAGISRIVYGARRSDVHAVYFESRHNDSTDFIRDAFRNDLDIEGGVLAEECSKLYAKPQELVEPDPAHKRTAPAF